jgi:hypothetical protein
MKVQPRQQILEIWRAVARTSFVNGSWVWGGRDGSNSISDAEQLLCLMTPATEVPTFKLDRPDETAEDVLTAMRGIGGSVEIPQRLVEALSEYMRTYTDESGTPIFSGGSYFASGDDEKPPTTEQQALDVVDSFATAVTLSLATLGFVKVFRTGIRREDLRNEVDALEVMASRRLSAAMVGLLRSFTVFVFDADSDEGRALVRTANQNGLPNRRIIEELRDELREIQARLRDDVTIGSGAGEAIVLDNPNRLFECGWSWGLVKDAPLLDTTEPVGEQRAGLAEAKPYLYFTVVALDGIQALFSERTRLLGLLNEAQQRLAQSLQLRWDLTQKYWSTIARFGNGRWPLEDVPWRTTDGVDSDYFTLLVTSIMTQDLIVRRASDEDLSRVGRILDELAQRSRITRRPFRSDRAIEVHTPGVSIDLGGGEEAGGAILRWLITDFSPLLLQRTVRIAGLLGNPEMRQRLLALADEVWEHITLRRLTTDPGRNLWDQARNVFPQAHLVHVAPSWYYTRRVVECLVTAATVISSPPLRSDQLTEFAGDLMNEAEHLFDQELLDGSSEAGPSMRAEMETLATKLRRARRILPDRPGTAVILIGEVLSALDRLAAAREDISEAG